MKKISTTLFVTAILLVGALGILPHFTKNSASEFAGILDRFNPFVSSGEVYVKTKKPDEVNGYKTATYRQTAVDKDGNTRKVEFNGLTELKLDHYLKLKNKGAFIKSYEEVSLNDLPEKAREYLN